MQNVGYFMTLELTVLITLFGLQRNGQSPVS